MTWIYDVAPAPAVGGKLTAAGFGLQVDGAVAELQSVMDTVTGGSAAAGASAWSATRDALLLHDWIRPGAAPIGLATTITAVTGGPTTILAGPASGRRVAKSILLSSPADTTCSISAAGSVIANLNLTAGSITGLDLLLPITGSETATATVTSGTVTAFVSYGDRADTVLTRLGLASTGTVVAAGNARTVGQVWIGNTSASVAATVSLTVGASSLLSSVSIAGGGVLAIDSPFAITNSQAISLTVAAGAVSCFVSGY